MCFFTRHPLLTSSEPNYDAQCSTDTIWLGHSWPLTGCGRLLRLCSTLCVGTSPLPWLLPAPRPCPAAAFHGLPALQDLHLYGGGGDKRVGITFRLPGWWVSGEVLLENRVSVRRHFPRVSLENARQGYDFTCSWMKVVRLREVKPFLGTHIMVIIVFVCFSFPRRVRQSDLIFTRSSLCWFWHCL